jgi:hypothetical protein
MVSALLVGIAGVAAVCSIAVLFGPIICTCRGSFGENAASADAMVFWIHPFLLRCDFDIVKRTATLILFKRFRLFTFALPGGGDEAPPETGPAAHKAVPPAQDKEEKQSPGFEDRGRAAHEPDESRAERPEKEPEPPGKKKKKRGAWFTRWKQFRVFWDDHRWRSKVLSWLKKRISGFFRIVSIRIISVRLRLGLAEPDETGAAYGYILGVTGALFTPANGRNQVLFDPVFDRECFEMEGRVRVTTSVMRLCAPLVLAVLTFPYLRTFLLVRRARKV